MAGWPVGEHRPWVLSSAGSTPSPVPGSDAWRAILGQCTPRGDKERTAASSAQPPTHPITHTGQHLPVAPPIRTSTHRHAAPGQPLQLLQSSFLTCPHPWTTAILVQGLRPLQASRVEAGRQLKPSQTAPTCSRGRAGTWVGKGDGANSLPSGLKKARPQERRSFSQTLGVQTLLPSGTRRLPARIRPG